MKANHRNHRTAWALSELKIVESSYGKEPTAGIARRLERTAAAVRQKARALGLGCNSLPWSDREEEVLRIEYARGDGITHVMSLLPGRTRKTIFQKARIMGITSGRSWTEEECHILAKHYPAKGVAMTGLPDRTPEAIKIKASYLGIRFTGDDTSISRPWTKEEKILLAENIGRPTHELYPLFPDRSSRAVQKARDRLKQKTSSTDQP